MLRWDSAFGPNQIKYISDPSTPALLSKMSWLLASHIPTPGTSACPWWQSTAWHIRKPPLPWVGATRRVLAAAAELPLCSINSEVLQEAYVCLVRTFSIRLGHQQLAGYKCSPKIRWLKSNYPGFLSAGLCQRRTQSCLPPLSGSGDSKYIIWRKLTNNRASDVLMERHHGMERGLNGQDAKSSTRLQSVSPWLRVSPSASLSSVSRLLEGDNNTNHRGVGSF